MAEWILKYWVEVLFSLAVGVITILYRRFLKLHKHEQDTGRQKFKEDIQNDIKKQIEKDIQTEFEKNSRRDEAMVQMLTKIDNSMGIMKQGLLSVQRRTFESDCRALLQKDHIITLDEFSQLTADHDIYKALGGNHNGDSLFKLVELKMNQAIQHQPSVQ